jgi:hypothetical protein
MRAAISAVCGWSYFLRLRMLQNIKRGMQQLSNAVRAEYRNED